MSIEREMVRKDSLRSEIKEILKRETPSGYKEKHSMLGIKGVGFDDFAIFRKKGFYNKVIGITIIPNKKRTVFIEDSGVVEEPEVKKVAKNLKRIFEKHDIKVKLDEVI
jgi:hypothetical protein